MLHALRNTVVHDRPFPWPQTCKVLVRNWHPLSKLSIMLGIVGLGALWLTDQEVASGTDRVAAVPNALEPASTASGLVRSPVAASPRGRSLPPVDAFGAMVERPLFASDRRPFDPTVAAAEAPPIEWEPMPAAGPSAPAFRFIGSIDENGVVRALVSDGVVVQSLTNGQEIDGWTVIAIESRRLVLAHDHEQLELTILE